MQSWTPIIHTDMKKKHIHKTQDRGEKTEKIMQHIYTNTWHPPPTHCKHIRKNEQEKTPMPTKMVRGGGTPNRPFFQTELRDLKY